MAQGNTVSCIIFGLCVLLFSNALHAGDLVFSSKKEVMFDFVGRFSYPGMPPVIDHERIRQQEKDLDGDGLDDLYLIYPPYECSGDICQGRIFLRTARGYCFAGFIREGELANPARQFLNCKTQLTYYKPGR